MDTWEAMRTIRAVRQYETRPVPDESITRILKAGRWTGSSKNTQPWQFILVRDRQELSALSQCGDYAQHLRSAAFAIVIVTEKMRRSEFDAGRCCQNLMLAAWDDGVGSCIASMHRADQARQILGIPDEMELQPVIAFGYPAPGAINPVPRKGARKPLDEILHNEKW